MARNDDDDDDDDRPKKRGARAEEEEEQQDEEDEEEERPRKKPAREEEDERDETPAKGKKPLPGKLVAAAAASMAWGGFNLYFSCIDSSNGLLNIIRSFNMRGNERFFQEIGGGQGWMYTTAAVYVFSVLFSLLLFVGGMLLLRRVSMGKFAAMGAPVALALTLLIGFVIALILTRGTFITQFFTATIVSFLFTVAVAGCNITMLMSKEASKALK